MKVLKFKGEESAPVRKKTKKRKREDGSGDSKREDTNETLSAWPKCDNPLDLKGTNQDI